MIFQIFFYGFLTVLGGFLVVLQNNCISYKEIAIFAKRISSKFCGYKSFKIRLLALSTTFVSSDAR